MFSLILCTYNRAESLAETLRSINAQVVPAEFRGEILVVDNNSKDKTRQAVEFFAGMSRWPVRYIFEVKQGLSHARNAGILAARGDVLGFLDDDVLVEPGWMAAMDKLFRETDADMAGGKILRRWDCKAPDWYTEEVGGPLIGQDYGSERKSDFRKGQYLIGASMAFRKSIFDKTGLFSVELGRKGNSLIGGEDKDIFERVSAAGGKIYYEPAAVIHHRVEQERLTKDYMRRWFYAIGQTAGHQMERKTSAAFTGAPLWVWGDFTAALFRYVRSRVFFRSPDAEKFASEVSLRYSSGVLAECLIHWLPFSGIQNLCVFREKK